jgi:hypothetical protein
VTFRYTWQVRIHREDGASKVASHGEMDKASYLEFLGKTVPGGKTQLTNAGLCCTCAHWRPGVSASGDPGCVSPKMVYGYGSYNAAPSHDDDMVWIENDEGWGIATGPEFGCVHWSAKP